MKDIESKIKKKRVKFSYSVIPIILFHILGNRIINPTTRLTTGPNVNIENANVGPSKNME